MERFKKNCNKNKILFDSEQFGNQSFEVLSQIIEGAKEVYYFQLNRNNICNKSVESLVIIIYSPKLYLRMTVSYLSTLLQTIWKVTKLRKFSIDLIKIKLLLD